MRRTDGAMHIDRSSRHYTAADGSVRVYRRDLLRRSYRDERGRPQKETVANLSALPEVALEVLRQVLSGTVVVEPDTTFELERSLSHGGLAAVHAMATKLGVKKLLGPDCRERDLAYALVISRVLRPTSTLSGTGLVERHHTRDRPRSSGWRDVVASWPRSVFPGQETRRPPD